MRRELTWQAIVSAVIVSALVSASYPYVVLKLGLGPNVSVVSAFLGALMLLALAPKTHGQNRWMNNVIQTAGTSAASTAFMCVIAAAVEIAATNPAMNSEKMDQVTRLEPWPMFWWLCCAGGIGVLFMVLFRRHFIDDPKMIFADGVAAAETIVVLDSRGPEAGSKLKMLGVTALASAIVDFLREGVKVIGNYYPRPMFRSYGVGMEWGFLTLGSGLLIGLNVGLSLLAGTVVFQAAGPSMVQSGIARDIALGSFSSATRERAETLIDKKWEEVTKEDKEFIAQRGGRLHEPELLLGSAALVHVARHGPDDHVGHHRGPAQMALDCRNLRPPARRRGREATGRHVASDRARRQRPSHGRPGRRAAPELRHELRPDGVGRRLLAAVDPRRRPRPR